MNAPPLHSQFLSTPRSVAIFGVALCIVVAATTGTVFLWRDHEIETQDSAARERETLEQDSAQSANESRYRVPWTVSYFGMPQTAPAVFEQIPDRNVWVLFSQPSVPIPNVTPVASSQSNQSEMSPNRSSAAKAAPQVPASVQSALATDERTQMQPLTGRETPSPAVIKVQCGRTQCPEREVCCNASCGTCAMPGDLCSQQVCGMSTATVSLPCGSNTCNVGEVCCNSSCGICLQPGDQCDASKQCSNPIEYPFSVTCGMSTCNTGLVCCNPSCGTCARFGDPCSQEACS